MCYLSPKPPFCKGVLFIHSASSTTNLQFSMKLLEISILCATQRRNESFSFFSLRELCVTYPPNPLWLYLPPSHLGKVCKHTLPSVWRRFCKGGLFIHSASSSTNLQFSMKPLEISILCATQRRNESFSFFLFCKLAAALLTFKLQADVSSKGISPELRWGCRMIRRQI